MEKKALMKDYNIKLNKIKYMKKLLMNFINIDMDIEINKWRIYLIELKSFKKKHKICSMNIKT